MLRNKFKIQVRFVVRTGNLEQLIPKISKNQNSELMLPDLFSQSFYIVVAIMSYNFVKNYI